MGYKLDFELVPDGCWYSNLRSILSKKQWDFLRADAKERSGGKCMICGKQTKYLDAHERWSYDEKSCVQKLEDIIAFHVAFERIHPFQDGNGRVGRLIMFGECLKHNIAPFRCYVWHTVQYVSKQECS